MKWGKFFWWTLILIAVNLIILALYAARDVRKLPEGFTKLSGMVWAESGVLAFLSAIPGVNYFVMLLMIPIAFFNVVTKLSQINLFSSSSNTPVLPDYTNNGTMGHLGRAYNMPEN